MTTPRPDDLGWPARLAWFAVNIVFGLAPSLLFFAWVEQDASLPAAGRLLGWPWLDLGLESVPLKFLWNASFFALFGLWHSGMAQLGVQGRLAGLVPARAMRSFYLAGTGSFLFLMMSLWQPTGVTLLRLPVSAEANAWLAGILFAVEAGVVLWLVVRLGFWEFLGWKQLFGPAASSARTAGTPELRTTGIYGQVRHPVYTGLLAMFLLGPTLSLDRLLVFAAALGYLSIGIPVEERKLIKLFGPAYEGYRRQVPALLPTGRRPAAAPAREGVPA